MEQKLERALRRVSLEIERTSLRARSNLVLLARQPASDIHKVKTRLQTMTLITDHNLLDAYQNVKACCNTLLKNIREVSRGPIRRKELTYCLAFLFHCACRVDLFELTDFSNHFQRKHGRKLMKRITDEFTVESDKMLPILRISRPIEESLIDRYLTEIFVPSPPIRTQTSFDPSDKPGVSASSQTDQIEPKSQGQGLDTIDGLSIAQLSPEHPIRIIRPNSRLEIAFDLRTRNPVYVLEKLLPGRDYENQKGVTKKRPQFFEEPTLPEVYRCQLLSFFGSGYDRGHMAPAADFGPSDMKHTFNMCNVSPQERSMNRSIWAQLEHWCRRVANSQNVPDLDKEDRNSHDLASTYVLTGPCWLPKHQSFTYQHEIEYPAIGPMKTMIHVPTHFFKVVIVVKKSKRQCINKFACFLVPNEKSNKAQKGRPKKLIDYVVHWDELEATSGLRFFPSLSGGNWLQKARCSTEQVLAARRKNARGAPGRQQKISSNAESQPEHLLWVSNQP